MLECILATKVLRVHEVGGDYGCASGYSCLAVHKHVAFAYVFLDESDGRVKVAFDVLGGTVAD